MIGITIVIIKEEDIIIAETIKEIIGTLIEKTEKTNKKDTQIKKVIRDTTMIIISIKRESQDIVVITDINTEKVEIIIDMTDIQTMIQDNKIKEAIDKMIAIKEKKVIIEEITIIKEEAIIMKEINIKEGNMNTEKINIKQETIITEKISTKEETMNTEKINIKEETIIKEKINIKEETMNTEKINIKEEMKVKDRINIKEETMITDKIGTQVMTIIDQDIKCN